MVKRLVQVVSLTLMALAVLVLFFRTPDTQTASQVILPDDCMAYIMDVTLDDTEALPVLTQGSTHVKTWRVRNCGTTTWKGYELRRVFYSGPQVGVGKTMSPLSAVVPQVGPGQEAGISITITVPLETGDYKALYEISLPEGSKPHYQNHRFGDPLWVSFTVQ